MSGRGHQLIHSDALSAELEALGLDSSLFGAAGIPAPIFQALVPRRAGVFDEHAHTFGTGDEPASFTRASDGIYRDANGNYQIAAANAIRAEYAADATFLGYLFEPAITNKVTAYNAAPDAALTNLTKAGDAASVMTRVDDAALLRAAGPGAVGNGFVVELDNSAGATWASIRYGGVAGNTNPHTLSGWGRWISGAGACRFQDSSFGTFAANFDDASAYVRKAATGAMAAGSQLEFLCAAGVVGRCVFGQFEELPVPTSPIITAGASATRAVDALLWSSVPAGFSHDAGTILLDFIPLFGPDAITANVGILSLAESTNNILSLGKTGADGEVRAHDGSVAATLALDGGSGPTSGQKYRIALRWNSATNKQIGLKNGSWAWSPSTYDGLWNNGGAPTLFRVMKSILAPVCLRNLRVWNRDIGAAEIERLF